MQQGASSGSSNETAGARIAGRNLQAQAALMIACVALMAPLVTHATAQTRAAPEIETGRAEKARVSARRHMVVAAHPLAADAGLEILRAGGTAVDAAIAVQMVLNVVEPQSSGIGGGAFLLTWSQADQSLQTFDGRERAPAAARPDRFLRDGKPIPFLQAARSGLGIGVPGVVRMLARAHARSGRLPWRKLFGPAIELAESGFPVSPRLHAMLSNTGPATFGPKARALFFSQDGAAHPVGFRLHNPALARTLKTIAAQGPDAFYTGHIAQAVTIAARAAPRFASDLTLDDMAQYQAVARPAVCGAYRGYQVCGMGPPSSGGLTVAQTLGLLRGFDLGDGPKDAMVPRALHLIAQAQRLAYADRNRYMADSDYVPVPSGLLDPAYLADRAKQITPDRALADVAPGLPPPLAKRGFGSGLSRERPGTSHVSIVDGDGNAVALTTSIEIAFGSGVMAAGFLLNNQLTDFAFKPTDDGGRIVANAVAPGKRPRSSMAPTMIFDPNGRLHAVLGSPGGSRIILYVVKAVIAMIDWRLDAQQAADLPNFGSRRDAFELERDRAPVSGDLQLPWQSSPQAAQSDTGPGDAPPSGGPDQPPKPQVDAGRTREPAIIVWARQALAPFGVTVRPVTTTSGLHIIQRHEDLWTGGADPRREGVARGD